MKFYTIETLQGQSLLDISIQEYGTAEGILFLVQDNGLEATSNPLPGTSLNIRLTPGIKNYRLLETFRGKMKINTGNKDRNDAGLGFMQIGADFEIN